MAERVAAVTVSTGRASIEAVISPQPLTLTRIRQRPARPKRKTGGTLGVPPVLYRL